MSISVLQVLAATGSTTAVASFQSGAFGSSTTTGNTILVFAWYYNASVTITGVVDTTGANTYVQDQTVTGGGAGANMHCDIWRASNITGGSTFKITATPSGNAYISICALEASGLLNVSPEDGSGNVNFGTATTETTGAFSTANASDLIVATFAATVVVTLDTRPSGFSPVGNISSNGTNIDGAADYEIVSVTQASINPQWTTTGAATWVAAAFAYKNAAAPTGNRRRRVLITAGGG